MAYKIISKDLDTTGDGSGTTNAIGNYASEATSFKIAPGDNQTFILHRLIISVEDAGAFDAAVYGNGITLTNGMVLRVSDASGVLFKLTGDNIKSNADWAEHCHDLTIHNFGIGNVIMTARWTFSESGVPIELNGDKGQFLEIVLNDDFSALVEHHFLIQGFSKNEGY